MDNGQVNLPDQRKATLENWGFKTGWICGAGALLAAHYSFNMDWIYSVLLFFPVAGLANAVIVNKPGKIFSNALWLVSFPILLGIVPQGSIISSLAGKMRIPAGSEVYLGRAAFGIIYLAFKVICVIIAMAVPDIEIGWKIHRKILIVIRSLGVLVTGCGLFAALTAADRKWNFIPSGIMLYVVMGAVVLFLLAVYKIYREVGELGAPGSGKDEEAKDNGTKLAERPSIRMKDVAGMAEVKEQIRLRLIEPVRDPKRAAQFGLKVGGGMLLYGPPGTGKTFIAKAVAGELNLPFYAITAADIFGRYVGESEQNLRNLFQSARQNKLSVIFIDELETIFRKRTGEIHEVTQKVISLLLQELDGIGGEGKNPILLLGATNMPWQVDEAFLRPGRFDILAFVDLPDAPARRQIIEHAFAPVQVSGSILDYIAEHTEKYSGADLNGVAMRIKQQAFDLRAKSIGIEIVHSVLASSAPSDNREIMEQLRKWRNSR